jgi:GcrA cell cycle regulator
MEWTSDRIAELTRLWNEGLSTAEIGKMLGISKNAVVGKAHRLHLASRPSPIRRLALRPAQTIRLREPRPAPTAFELPRRAAGVAPAQPVAPRPAPVETRVLEFSNQSCMWPVGHPGEPGFRFCGERALMGKPYCVDHCAVAYVKAKPKAGEAA